MAHLSPSASFEITVVRVSRLLLMWPPSFKRWPSAPVRRAFSEPARSTNVSVEDRMGKAPDSREPSPLLLPLLLPLFSRLSMV